MLQWNLALLLLLSAGAAIVAAYFYARHKNKKSLSRQQTADKEDVTRPLLERMDGKPLDSIDEEIVRENAKIVGVVTPVGPWSEMIFTEKFNYIMDKINGNKPEGYWVKLIRAQRGARDEQKGKER